MMDDSRNEHGHARARDLGISRFVTTIRTVRRVAIDYVKDLKGVIFPGQTPYGENQPRIKPLVDAMNATGVIQTVASCQGHVVGIIDPYVYFRATPDIAGRLERALRACNAANILLVPWTLDCNLNDECEILFMLRSYYYRRQV